MAVPAKAFTSVDTPNAFEDTTLYLTDMRYPPSVNSLITIDHLQQDHLTIKLQT